MTQTNNVLGQRTKKGNFDPKLAARVNKETAAKNRQKKLKEQRKAKEAKEPKPKQSDKTANLEKIIIDMDNVNEHLPYLQENKEYELENGRIYWIKKEIIIPENTKLIIPANVELFFDKDVGITNNGTLRIRGTRIQKAVLTAFEENEGWGNILNHGYLLIENAHLSYGRGGDCGGAINNMNKANIIDSELKNNQAEYGGAIYNDHNAELNIKGTNIFKNNKATQKGGAIQNNGASILNIEGSNIFENNKAEYGGAIRNYNGTVNIKGKNTFKNNQAKNGGAISWHEEEPKIDPRTIYDHNTPNDVSKNV